MSTLLNKIFKINVGRVYFGYHRTSVFTLNVAVWKKSGSAEPPPAPLIGKASCQKEEDQHTDTRNKTVKQSIINNHLIPLFYG